MFTTIINDCQDDNARGRQESRIGSLIESSISFVGVESDLEAGMQLVDMIDATEGRPGLILVNVAPRGGHARKWENGTPFGYFWHQNTLAIASVDGFVLSGVRELGLVKDLLLLDTHSAADIMLKSGYISDLVAKEIPHTQFRSFDFITRAGVFMFLGNPLPSEPYGLENIPDLPKAIWHIDNFGNCKTTLTKRDITPGVTMTRFGDLPFHTELKDVPDNTASLIEGSSGIAGKRFVELVIERGSFAKSFGAKIGDSVFTEESFFRKATS